jgi:DNA-binding PadR family transcriptional regulator
MAPWSPTGVPLWRSDMTAQEYARETGGAYAPAVPANQPPPADMPPLPLMVLDSLTDDVESIYSMRNCGEMEAYDVALVGESYLLDTLRSLLSEGLLEVEAEHVVIDGRLLTRPPAPAPGTSDDDLRRYWFRITPAGHAKLRAAAEMLDSYAESHPLRIRENPGPR